MSGNSEGLSYRVILIGNCKVGKTSFLNYVIGRGAKEKSLTPTIGVEYAPVNLRVGSKDVRVNIWDTCRGGYRQQERNSTCRSPGPTTARVMEPSSCSTSPKGRALKISACGSNKSSRKSRTRCQRSSLPTSQTWSSRGRRPGQSPKRKQQIFVWSTTSVSRRLLPRRATTSEKPSMSSFRISTTGRKSTERSLSAARSTPETQFLQKGKKLDRSKEIHPTADVAADYFCLYNTIQMKENYLHVWGKNFPLPQALRQKVLSAAAGENHILFTTASGDTFGMGSNRFGQLGLKEPQFYQQPVPIFEGHRIASLHCGAEHSFFINDRNEVYSTGLNVKGQLGFYHFQNVYSPTLVVGLLPYGAKNSKAEKSIASKQPKSPIVEVLQRFDLQVKIQDQNQKICILNHDQLIVDIACGALFTVALSNAGRVFVSGLIGGGLPGSIEEQTERTRFRVIEIAENIQSIDAGLSGASALTSDGKAFIWGRFGKILLNIPRRIQLQQKDLPSLADDLFCEVKVGDQCAFALTIKGEILSFGQNIDNQLGCEQHILPFKDKFSRVEDSPFAQKIYVGRNTVFAVDAENSEVFGWGSNKYGQIFPGEDPKGLMPITNLKFQLDQHDILIPSSYFTLLLSKRAALSNLFSSIKKDSESSQQTIPLTEYKKLLRDYQILKALNMTLLQKSQTSRKENKQVQTPSKFQISGITQHRKFNSNIEIGWKELQIESQINEGGYGIIYKAKWRQIMVVVKKFKIQNGDVSLRDFLSQCHAMEAVRHPNIVMFLGAVTTSPNYSIILEYCPKGSLWSYLQNRDNNIAWEERRRFSIQIAQGVHYLHSCTPPILHRDLKSLNIFLDGSLRIKIGDFGWTKTLQEYMTNKIGTYQWMAPEVIGNKPYSQKADVFSYSIIMWEIASREPPYRNINGTKVSEEVLNRDLRPTVPNKCPEAYAKLMRRCWDSDPSRRPSFREIVKELEVMKLSSV